MQPQLKNEAIHHLLLRNKSNPNEPQRKKFRPLCHKISNQRGFKNKLFNFSNGKFMTVDFFEQRPEEKDL